MRIPTTLQDKMKLALGLSLVCGNLQSLPVLDNNAAQAQAANPQASKTTKKQAAKKVEKSAQPAKKEEEEESCCLQPPAKTKKGGTAKDPCPACGRG